jgi:hypothetical protein
MRTFIMLFAALALTGFAYAATPSGDGAGKNGDGVCGNKAGCACFVDQNKDGVCDKAASGQCRGANACPKAANVSAPGVCDGTRKGAPEGSGGKGACQRKGFVDSDGNGVCDKKEDGACPGKGGSGNGCRAGWGRGRGACWRNGR